MKILNAEPQGYSAEARKILTQIGEVVEVQCDRPMLLDEVADADALIVRLGHKIDDEVFGRAKRLQVLVSATTGLNHIDLAAAAKHGVEVLCLRGERAFLDSVTATAELTWGLIISLLRHLVPSSASVLQGQWDRDRFRGTQLSGKTIGLIGYGRLGHMVADYAKAFRMDTVFCDPNVEALPSGPRKVGLTELLEICDVVSIHASYSPDNFHLIGADAFARMKPSAVLINTARGELIDEEALLDALRSERIAGAALDVLDGEADRSGDWMARHPLLEYARTSSKLILTPHVGGATFDSMRDAEIYMANMLEAYWRNRRE